MDKLNRWHIYNALKNGNEIDIQEVEIADPEEVKEGVIEYLLAKKNMSCI